MKKLSIYFIISLLLSVNSFAQKTSSEFKIQTGKEVKQPRFSSLIKIITSDESGFYVLKSDLSIVKSKEDYYIEHFTNKMIFDKSSQLTYTDKNGNKGEFINAFYIGNAIVQFFKVKDKDEKKIKIYAQKIDKNTLKPDKAIKMLIDLDYKNNDIQNTIVDASNDFSKILIAFIINTESDNKLQTFIKTYDADFNALWTLNKEFSFSKEILLENNYKIDNDGNVFLLGRTSIVNPNSKYLRDKYLDKCQFVTITHNGEEINNYTFKNNGKYINSIKMMISNDNKVVCAAYYSNYIRNIGNSAAGSICAIYDTKSEQFTVNTCRAFDSKLLAQNLSAADAQKINKKLAKGDDVEIDNLYLNDIKFLDDGSVVIFGEQSNHLSTTSCWDFYRKDIVIEKYTSDNMYFAKKIAKRQEEKGDINDRESQYISYSVLKSHNKMYIVYIDNVKNIDIYDEDNIKTVKPNDKASICYIELEENLKYVKKVLIDPEKADKIFYIQTRMSFQLSENEFILNESDDDKTRFIKISL
ncbi:MAG: hypothetical protein NTZ33_09490 [Bacteroidetes bacterium]|nr:hypothetical protein [Bacteroidota bacterium]